MPKLGAHAINWILLFDYPLKKAGLEIAPLFNTLLLPL